MRSTLRPTGTPYRISVATALGGLSRAIDQNDFACAAGTAAAMAEAQPTLPVPTIPIFIDPSGVDRSQRDVSRSVPGEINEDRNCWNRQRRLRFRHGCGGAG